MSNLNRRVGLFACLLVAVFGLSSWSFASPLDQDSPSAGEKPQATQDAKTTRKKKKKKKVGPTFVMLAPMPNQTAVGPVQLRNVEVIGTGQPALAPKGSAEVAAAPKIGVSPATSDPHPLGVASTLVI